MLKPRCSRALGALVLACWTTACGPAVDEKPVREDTRDDSPDDDLPPLPAGAFGIASVEMTDSTSDLQPFLAATASNDVIGLGEMVHTSGGFYALKERLIRALVEEQGVRVLSIETPRTAAQGLDAYVGGEDCSEARALTAAQTGVFPVFVDDHFISLMQSLCTFNQTHNDDPVRVYGFDAQQPERDAPAVAAWLRTVAPDDAPRLLDGITTCIQTYSLEITDDAYAACVDGLDDINAFIDDHADALAATDPAGLATFRIDLQSLASWQDEAFFFETDVVRSYEARDLAMAAIFLDQRARFFPGERVAMWAHDYHLSMAHDEEPNSYPFAATSMGCVLHDTLGARYAAFAITAVEARINWPDLGNGVQPRNAPGIEDAVADLLVEGAREVVLLAPDAALLQGEQSLGYMFFRADLTKNFSGVFVLRDSPGMNAVFW